MTALTIMNKINMSANSCLTLHFFIFFFFFRCQKLLSGVVITRNHIFSPTLLLFMFFFFFLFWNLKMQKLHFFFFFFSCVPSYNSGNHHFGEIFAHVTRGSHIPSSSICISGIRTTCQQTSLSFSFLFLFS